MTQNLSSQEQVNLRTFSDKAAVTAVYNKEGLTPLEQRLIDAYFKPAGSVLDIGCGTGRTTAPLAAAGHAVIGIDYSAEMITFARTKYPDCDFRVMNACSLDFVENHFDYVLFSFTGLDSIAPYAKRLECLREIHRVLKPGGIFIYSSHNALCLPVTRILLGMFRRNVLSLRLFTRYRQEESTTGKLVQFYGIPFFEKRTMKRLGFTALETAGRRHSTEPFITFLELSPYYVMKKV